MNKFVKDGIVIGVIGIVGIGGYVGYKIHTVNEVVDKFVLDVEELNKNIPYPLTATHILTKGLFESKGEYVVKLAEDGDFIEMKVNYKVKHGIASAFSNEYPITGNVEIEDNRGMVNALNIDKNLLELEGTFFTNGNVNLKGVSKKLNLTKTIGVNIEPIEISYKYNTVAKNVFAEISIPSVKNEMGMEVKNLKITLDNSTENWLIGSGKTQIELLKSPYAEVNNFNGEFKSTKEKDKYQLGFKLNVGEIKTLIADSKKANVDIDFNIKDIDAKFFEQYYETMKQKNIEEIENDELKLDKLFKKGFSFNLNNLLFKDGANVLAGKAAIKIKEQDDNEPVDLKENIEVAVNLKGKGDFIEVIKNMNTGDTNYFEGQPEDEANLEFAFGNKRLIINKKEAQPEELEQINSVFDEASDNINNN